MGHGARVSNINRTITGGLTLVGGVQRKIAKGLTLVNGVQREIGFLTYDPIFSNNDWTTIIAACERRSVPDTWNVGDTKAVGSNEVVIIGKNHDEYVGGKTKAPLTLQFKNSLGKYRIDSSTSLANWSSCELRNTTLPTILSSLPSEVKAGIKQVKKPYFAGSGTAYASDRLFILSAVELFGDNSLDHGADGTQYEYYITAENRKKETSYWTRSVYTLDLSRFLRVNTYGVMGAAELGTTELGTYPAFCF